MTTYKPDSPEFRRAISYINELLPGMNAPDISTRIQELDLDEVEVKYMLGSLPIKRLVRTGDGNKRGQFHMGDIDVSRDLGRSREYVYDPTDITVVEPESDTGDYYPGMFLDSVEAPSTVDQAIEVLKSSTTKPVSDFPTPAWRRDPVDRYLGNQSVLESDSRRSAAYIVLQSALVEI